MMLGSDTSSQVMIDGPRPERVARNSAGCLGDAGGLSHDSDVTVTYDSSGLGDASGLRYLDLVNLQTDRPSRHISDFAVNTFRKMNHNHLSLIENLYEELTTRSRVDMTDVLKMAATVVTEVWNREKDSYLLDRLLKSNPEMESLGKEFLVLYNNAVSDSVYLLRNRKRDQRFSGSSNRSLQRVCVGGEGHETVISTFTSPSAFTPEMEALLKSAAVLGIPTDDCTLKTFATERSLSAFLKKLIIAKKRKGSVMRDFNKKLMGVLSRVPDPTNPESKNHFKYSFSKICRYSMPEESPVRDRRTYKSLTDLDSRKRLRRGPLNDGARISPLVDKRASVPNRYEFSRSYDAERRDALRRRKFEGSDTMFFGRRNENVRKPLGLSRSFSDSYLSVVTCDSFSCVHDVDDSRHFLECRDTGEESLLSQDECSLIPVAKDRTWKKELTRLTTPMEKMSSRFRFLEQNKTIDLGELSEERSFFKLGDGALLRLSEERKGKKSKKVHWSDEPKSLEALLLPSPRVSSPESHKVKRRRIFYELNRLFEPLLSNRIHHPGQPVPRCQVVTVSGGKSRTLSGVASRAVAHATILAFIIWMAILLYLRTPELVDIIKRLRLRYSMKEYLP